MKSQLGSSANILAAKNAYPQKQVLLPNITPALEVGTEAAQGHG